MIKPVRSGLALALACTTFVMLGCSTEPAEEEVATQGDGLIMMPTAPRPGGTDADFPAPKCPDTVAKARLLQPRVTAAFKYAIGGPIDPLVQYPCSTQAKTDNARWALNYMRALLDQKDQWDDCSLSATPTSYDTPCGIKGIARRMTCTTGSGFNADAALEVRGALEQCWEDNVGKGAGAFFFAFRKSTGNTYYIDPEPVELRSTLVNANNATASAVDKQCDTDGVCSYGTETRSVVRWPGVPTSGTTRSPLPAIGAYCATGGLGYGQETMLSIVEKSATQRSCE